MHQYEISTGPLSVIAAIDAVICTREIITEVATRYGYTALFQPKPVENGDSIGLHFHLSIHDRANHVAEHPSRHSPLPSSPDPKNTTAQYSRSFLAGILDRLVSLCAFSMPNEESYRRSSDREIMGEYVAWGKLNGSVPISEVSPTHWEVRTLDWTANIYLAAAAYISAGLLGVKEEKHLQWQDPGGVTWRQSEELLKEKCITTKLPTNFNDSMKKLVQGDYLGLETIMGSHILELYVNIKQAEKDFISSLSAEERRTLFLLHF